MQGSRNYDSVLNGHQHGLLAPRSEPRRLEGVDSALGVKMLNVSLTDIAVHYYEAQTLLREAIDRVAAAFGVEPSRVVPLQLRPDEREATTCAVWTFTIRGIPSYDLLGHMREMFKQSRDAFGEWRFGSRKVLLEPFSFGLVGVVDGIPSSSLRDLMVAWQRPGVDADWRHDAELWLKLRDFEWMKSLKDSSSEFEDRLLKLRNTVASIFQVQNPRALQVAKLSTASDGTIIQLTPATPDKQEHAEHLNRWLPAVESGKVSQMLPGIALDFWSIRIPETGRPLLLPALTTSTTTSTPRTVVRRVMVDPDVRTQEPPKASLVFEDDSGDSAPASKIPPVLIIVAALAILVVVVAAVGLCIFCCRRGAKSKFSASVTSSKHSKEGPLPVAVSAKPGTAAKNRSEQPNGTRPHSSSRNRGYAN